MEPVKSSFENIDDLIAQHGPWSAMSIRLGDAKYTKEDTPDFRLRRILQLSADMVGKPINQCRVLDLACLEGQYAIEFALHGALAVGIELREANVVKAAYAAEQLKLDNVAFYQDDVNNLNPAQYGQFDIIICSGILYHLRGADAYDMFRKMRECCTGVAIVDTFISLSGSESIRHNGKSINGSVYKEHDEGTSQENKLADLWASVDNDTSFWLDEASILNAIMDAGFTSAHESLLPFHSPSTDRRTIVAMCGTPIEVLSSDASKAARPLLPHVRDLQDVHASQVKRSFAFKAAKQLLPQSVKNAIKPILRSCGILTTKEGQFN